MNRTSHKLQRAGVAIQAALGAHYDQPQLVLRARNRLISRFLERGSYGGPGRVWRWRGWCWRGWCWRVWGAALGVVSALLAVWSAGGSAPSFEVVGLQHAARTNVGDVIATGEQSATVVFSEGSAVSLGARSSARVLSLQPERARVLLESGELRAALGREQQERRWDFEAGPFRAVTAGKVLHLAWNAARSTLTLSSDGPARVFASCLETALEIGAGQLRQISCPGSDLDLVAR